MHVRSAIPFLAIVVMAAAGCDGSDGSAGPTPLPNATASAFVGDGSGSGGLTVGPDSYGPLSLGMTVEQAGMSDPTMRVARSTDGFCDIGLSDLGRLQFRDGVLVQIEVSGDSGAATPEGVRPGDLLGFAAGRYQHPTITSEGVVVAAPGSTSGSFYLFDNPAVTPDALAKNEFGNLRVAFIAVRRDGFCSYN